MILESMFVCLFFDDDVTAVVDPLTSIPFFFLRNYSCFPRPDDFLQERINFIASCSLSLKFVVTTCKKNGYVCIFAREFFIIFGNTESTDCYFYAKQPEFSEVVPEAMPQRTVARNQLQ